AHLLTVTNRIEHYAIANREGRWSRNPDFCYWDFPHMELSGKLFGIIGLGNIGQRVAAIAHAFGMRVCAYTSKSENQLPSYVEKKSMEEILSACDVISLHCPLTPDTRHLINSQTLQKMKPSAILINTGRGPLIDDQAVADALAEGRLAAFCADVLTEEPPKATNPLLAQPNAFTTPHIAWASTEARIRLLHIAIDNVRSFLSGHPQNVV
ncbi:MAG: D-2-hydroxyacid dehydrogenase, partial [Paludibacteraceae bacterium]|nr:D-2-hydroxyacid dehydrogenase [Paludibacteraceae bacterium]